MDLSKLSVDPDNQVGILELRHPVSGEILEDDDGNKVTITLNGPDSEAIKKVERRWLDKRLKDGVKRKKINVTRAEIEDQALKIDIAATVDWEGIELDGEELECTPENVREVYRKFPWIREQVEEYFNDRANFLGN